MITVGLILFGTLLFVLGVIVGSFAKKDGTVAEKRCISKAPQMGKEVKNFLSYDGTDQE